MCRWMAYCGEPLYLEELLFEPEHSLIDQSLSSSSKSTTNGDGFGIGWYGHRDEPAVFRDTRPAWNDRNLRDLARQICAPIFLAHVRATTGTEVQRSNCHPFRCRRWLFMHNGVIREFEKVKRDLVFEIDPELFPEIQGTTDSEIMFLLALGFGLDDEPFAALERMAGLVEAVGERHGVDDPLEMTLGLSDGDCLYAVRYASAGRPPTLFHSLEPEALEEIDVDVEKLSDDARLIVSEPLTSLTEAWEEIPRSTAVRVDGTGGIEERDFAPRRNYRSRG